MQPLRTARIRFGAAAGRIEYQTLAVMPTRSWRRQAAKLYERSFKLTSHSLCFFPLAASKQVVGPAGRPAGQPQ